MSTLDILHVHTHYRQFSNCLLAKNCAIENVCMMIGYLVILRAKGSASFEKISTKQNNCPKIALFEFRILCSNTSEENW